MTVWRVLTSAPVRPRAAGLLASAVVTVPADVPPGALLSFRVDQSAADRENPAVSCRYALERLEGVAWRHLAGGTWRGTPVVDVESGDPQPRCTVAVVTLRGDGTGARVARSKVGWTVRGTVEVPAGGLSVGWTLAVLV